MFPVAWLAVDLSCEIKRAVREKQCFMRHPRGRHYVKHRYPKLAIKAFQYPLENRTLLETNNVTDFEQKN